jgi:hypothetical protein
LFIKNKNELTKRQPTTFLRNLQSMIQGSPFAFTKVPYDLGHAEALCETCRIKILGKQEPQKKEPVPQKVRPKPKIVAPIPSQKSKSE